MTTPSTLIYRGIAHDGQRTATQRKPRDLIYRGVAHDGLTTPASAARPFLRDMCYRGIRHIPGLEGRGARGAGTRRLADLLV